jgi:hypothetical protein
LTSVKTPTARLDTNRIKCLQHGTTSAFGLVFIYLEQKTLSRKIWVGVLSIALLGYATYRLMNARLYQLALSTDHLTHFIVFGSFVTSKPEPGDVDIFLVMSDDFEVSSLRGDAAVPFGEHTAVQARLGASIFWVRRSGALGGIQNMIEGWQYKRDGSLRGIVEIIQE